MKKFNDQVESVLHSLEQKRDEGVYPSIPREVGELLYNLVKKNSPRRILEIGGCVGYSTIWLALAAKDIGSGVETIEWTKERADLLRQNVDACGLDNVTVHNEDAKKVLAGLSGEYDLVFIDAMKREYKNYFELLDPHFSKRAIIVCDNILSHRDALKDFVEYVKNRHDFKSEIDPIGSGLLISYKK